VVAGGSGGVSGFKGSKERRISHSLPPNSVKCRLVLEVLSLPKTMPLTLEQSGPFIKIQKMCYNLDPLLNYSTGAVVLNYNTEAGSIYF
jgi:hypothetical protein